MVSPCVYCGESMYVNLRKRTQKVWLCPACGRKSVVRIIETLQDNLFDNPVKKKTVCIIEKGI